MLPLPRDRKVRGRRIVAPQPQPLGVWGSKCQCWRITRGKYTEKGKQLMYSIALLGCLESFKLT